MTDTLPNDIDIERCVLGAIFFEPESIAMVLSEGITSNTFYNPTNGIVFRAMDELHEEGLPIDQLSVTTMIKSYGKFDQLEWDEIISSLACETTSSANVLFHAQTLRKLELRRKVIAITRSIQELAKDDSGNGYELIDVLESQIFTIKDEFKTRHNGLTDKIKEYVKSTTGIFQSTDVIKSLEKSTKVNSRKVSTILGRMVKEGVIVRAGTRTGTFRKMDDDCLPFSMDGVKEDVFDIKWPLELEKLVEVMPKNIVVIAGQSNSGKSNFLLNLAKLNMHDHEIHYFSSEMGDRELKKTLRRFDDLLPEQWNVNWYERSSNFSDVIRPDAINIIDFLEMTSDMFLVGERIKEIFDRLNKGIAIIAIQKDPQKEFGRGGSMSIEKARLYLTVDFDTAKRSSIFRIKKSKLWATDENPNGMECSAKIISGMGYRYTPWQLPEEEAPVVHKPRTGKSYYDKD
jgi:energy-coupling factor transporter ATP-binding protein EcfA2